MDIEVVPMGALGEIPRFEVANGNELIDLVDLALIFAAISAAAEVLGQYQSWREGRQTLKRRLGGNDERRLAYMRNVLLRVADRAEAATRAMDQLAAKMAEAISLIEPENHELLYQIPFVTGYKGRVRRRDRTRYRNLVIDVQWHLADLLRMLDEIAELVADLVPPQSDEEMLQAARVSAAEHRAINEVLRALGDDDTSFGHAIDLVMELLGTSRPYLGFLRQEALGDSEEGALASPT